MNRSAAFLAIAFAVVLASSRPAIAADQTHNVILFVPDGLRALMVSGQNAPAMAALRDQGVNFRNSHSLFPTFTMPNSSAMATGHYLGDTGGFGNTLFSGVPVLAADGAVTPFIENDAVLGELDERFGGDFLNETTLLAAARAAGLSTAAIGKVGPTLVFDHTARTGESTIVLDDATGSPSGIPLSRAVIGALNAAGLPVVAPSRGENGKAGNAQTAGTTAANIAQQDYFADAASKVVLPMFKARGAPFMLVFWSRDPDGSQHNQGDSLNRLTPGINGPTSLAAIRNADNDLARLRAALNALGLTETTDILIAADHGFSTISKESRTSPAARQSYADVPQNFLPPGFLALDLAKALGLPLLDPNARNAPVAEGSHPRGGNGLLGSDPARPEVVVAANGGSDLVYLPNGDGKLAAKVIEALLAQDYVSGLFVDESLGRFPGTLPLGSINLRGSAVTPKPAIAVNFRSFSTGCDQPTNCTAEVADTTLQQGQGMHGNFSRADTLNFMAAIGPDFKAGFVDEAPVSNADIGRTITKILGLRVADNGKLAGRVLAEAMPGGKAPAHVKRLLRSAQARNGLRTVLQYQAVGKTRYFDAGGLPGFTVGLP
ncbi:MAG TPA: alkaline phosphatase family protein [Burkholderiales bacterium]|nr:alkaline phosphatase family protein [Burkholderiales bacterium]